MHAPNSGAGPSLPATLEQFDVDSGSRLERLVFNNRRAVLAVCLVLTVLLGALAVLKLTLNASFEKMIPAGHPYIQNYLEHKEELRGLGGARGLERGEGRVRLARLSRPVRETRLCALLSRVRSTRASLARAPRRHARGGAPYAFACRGEGFRSRKDPRKHGTQAVA